MAAGGKILGAEHSPLNVFTEKIFVRVGGHRAVRRQITALRAQNDFFARKTFRPKLLQRRADAAFAALEAIINRAVEDVDAALHGGKDSNGIRFIGLFVGLAEIGSDSQRGKRHSVCCPEMAGSRASSKPLRVVRG